MNLLSNRPQNVFVLTFLSVYVCVQRQILVEKYSYSLLTPQGREERKIWWTIIAYNLALCIFFYSIPLYTIHVDMGLRFLFLPFFQLILLCVQTQESEITDWAFF